MDHLISIYKLNFKLTGNILLWVDNIFYRGVLYSKTHVMEEVSTKFLIRRTEEKTFMYIGLAIDPTNQEVTLNQINNMKDRLKPVQQKVEIIQGHWIRRRPCCLLG